MNAAWRPVEHDVRRVLAALECVDGSTGARIAEPLRLAAPGARFVRNPGGLYVLCEWNGLAAHADAFAAPPAAPAVASQALDVEISDPGGIYMARSVRLLLPRDPNPAAADPPDSLFRPQRVPMLRAAAAPRGANWATLFISVAASGSGDALGGALVDVAAADARPLARGVTDWRGECVLPVVGVPVTTWGDGAGAVVVAAIDASVGVRWSALNGSRVAQSDVAAARAPGVLPVIDPDRFPAVPAPAISAPIAVSLAAGRAQALRVVLTVAA